MAPLPMLAPPTAPGWTHIWDGGSEQLAITEDMALTLCYLGIIRYSGDYRIYRPVKNWETGKIWTLEKIRDEVIAQ